MFVQMFNQYHDMNLRVAIHSSESFEEKTGKRKGKPPFGNFAAIFCQILRSFVNFSKVERVEDEVQ